MCYLVNPLEKDSLPFSTAQPITVMNASPITLTFILQINQITPDALYHLSIKGIEGERLKLKLAEDSQNAAEYRQALHNIFQYQRILSVLRRDTLDSLIRGQSVN